MSPYNASFFIFVLLVITTSFAIPRVRAAVPIDFDSPQLKLASSLVPTGIKLETLLRRYRSLQRLHAAIKIRSLLPTDPEKSNLEYEQAEGDLDDGHLIPHSSTDLLDQIYHDLVSTIDDTDSHDIERISETDVLNKVAEALAEGTLLIDSLRQIMGLSHSSTTFSPLYTLTRASTLIHLLDDELDELETLQHDLNTHQKKGKATKISKIQGAIQAALRQIDRLLQQLEHLLE